jgi:hypothetical protein
MSVVLSLFISCLWFISIFHVCGFISIYYMSVVLSLFFMSVVLSLFITCLWFYLCFLKALQLLDFSSSCHDFNSNLCHQRNKTFFSSSLMVGENKLDRLSLASISTCLKRKSLASLIERHILDTNAEKQLS